VARLLPVAALVIEHGGSEDETIAADLAAAGDSVWDRFNGRREGTLWYYGEILKALEGRPVLPSGARSAKPWRKWIALLNTAPRSAPRSRIAPEN